MIDVIRVEYQGVIVGYVSYDDNTGLGAFEYDRQFVDTGVELSPLKMPLSNKIYQFPGLSEETFKGMPGMVADSLPDDFGNEILNAWVASQGRAPSEITPLERLQYTGKRGMGALEYLPVKQRAGFNGSEPVQISQLVEIAQEIVDSREKFNLELSGDDAENQDAMRALMSVGMSAGGARPKAVLAFNDDFTEVRSGQATVPEGFTHYLMKFDGVSEHNASKETFGDPMGYGIMEYVYYLMATDCAIDMEPTQLFSEGDRRHFLTRRFDRRGNDKIHIQTLNGLAHVDFKKPGSYSYEELFGVLKALGLSRDAATQLFRRMAFNIVARNHDDHAKNFAFKLTDAGWELAPAYDVAYSYKPGSRWVNSHWMSLNGKRDNFVRDDFYKLRKLSPLFKKSFVDEILDEVVDKVSRWPELAKQHDVPQGLAVEIAKNQRLAI